MTHSHSVIRRMNRAQHTRPGTEALRLRRSSALKRLLAWNVKDERMLKEIVALQGKGA